MRHMLDVFKLIFSCAAKTPHLFTSKFARYYYVAIPPPQLTTTTTRNTNHLIQSLCKKGQLKQALKLLSHEPNATIHTYELLSLCCAHQKSLSHALTLHQHLIDNGLCQNPFLATKLICMYSELKAIDNARQVFHNISHKTIYVCNLFFRALTLSGIGEEVLNLYRTMNFSGVPSDSFTYIYALKACVTSEGSVLLLKRGKEIHANILRNMYMSHLHIMTTLVDMYARYGRVSNASDVFNAMPMKSVVSWSAMIACYAINMKPFEALKLFREMMLKNSDVLPNSVTMVSVSQACGSLASLEQGKMIHAYILRKGLDSILPVINSLITMYAKCGHLKLGRHVFDKMEKRDVVSWNSMISCYGLYGFGKEAVKLFNEMVKNGIVPSQISFASVLNACSNSGLVEEGKVIFESMVKEFNIQPNVDHYACIVDLLGKANELDKAAKVIEDMQIKPGPRIWGSLLGSCKIHCNVKLAEQASKHLFELEPTNSGNYMLLAQVYAKAGMFKEVKMVEKVLIAKGLEKISGVSLIEVKKQIYTFTSVDKFNPKNEQIHAFLTKLVKELKDEGYIPETRIVLYDLEIEEKEGILLGHSEKLAVAFGLIYTSKGETIRITKNLRLCEDCHSFMKIVSKFCEREILVRDISHFHHFRDGLCSCGDYC